MIRWSPRGKQRLLGCMRYIAEQSQDWPTVINWRSSLYDPLYPFAVVLLLVAFFSLNLCFHRSRSPFRTLTNSSNRRIEISAIACAVFLPFIKSFISSYCASRLASIFLVLFPCFPFSYKPIQSSFVTCKI